MNKLKTIIIKTINNEYSINCKKCNSNNIQSIDEREGCKVNTVTNLNTRERYEDVIEDGESINFRCVCMDCGQDIHYSDVQYLQEMELAY